MLSHTLLAGLSSWTHGREQNRASGLGIASAAGLAGVSLLAYSLFGSTADCSSTSSSSSTASNGNAKKQAPPSPQAARAEGSRPSTPTAPTATPSAPQSAPPSLAGLGGVKVNGLPHFGAEEVAKHKTAETGIWVTFREGVYDITEFVAGHPGGERILQAAGSSIEPFWELYSVHKQDAVYRMLEEYRIGNTNYSPPPPKQVVEDAYANEPTRHPALKIHVQKPFIGETPLRLLTQSLITPTDVFFVRHHLPVPEVSEAE